ncbi:MAG: twin-arginine translocase TatA/TatE family subunit [Elusimicrobia bacterium]|nr:twin-arginine translocase TatA/TatE family subunit [Elusimicrobiota bacterium]
MFDIGFSELLVILLVALLLFGAKRVPEVARAIGQSVNAFKNGLKEASRNVEEAKTEAKKLPEESKT